MIIYDKLIGYLLEDFYFFKTKIHYFFPKIYDTKVIGMSLGKYERTKLDDLYKTLCKRNYNNYVNFYSDVPNGFQYIMILKIINYMMKVMILLLLEDVLF